MACAVHGFPEAEAPARQLADQLGIAYRNVHLSHFPDGESLVEVQPAGTCALLYRSLDDPNAKLVEVLLAASALRDGGTNRLILVTPYLPYMRQDIAFASGQAVSQKVICGLLAQVFDAVLTVDPHLHRTASLAQVMAGTEAVSISAAALLARSLAPGNRLIVAGPDAESRQWVEAIAGPIGADMLIGEKRRIGDREVVVAFPNAKQVKGRPVVLVDDVISTGMTLAQAARELLAAGAASVEVLATHCLASAADLANMREAGIARIRSTDSVAGPTAAIPLAELLADAVRNRGWLADSEVA
jgi:ribose-phosphate pyrophosphokinase